MEDAIQFSQSTAEDVVINTAQVYNIHETRGGNMGFSVAYAHQAEVLEGSNAQGSGGGTDGLSSEDVYIEPELLLDVNEEGIDEPTDEGICIEEGAGNRRKKRVRTCPPEHGIFLQGFS